MQAQKVGKVFIITNASEGWVQHSSSLCMPGIQADLAQASTALLPLLPLSPLPAASIYPAPGFARLSVVALPVRALP